MKSIMEPRGAYECYNCGDTRNLEEHHIFYGTRNRKKSEHYGLKVHLCPGCHRHKKTGVHGGNAELDACLKKEAERLFEKNTAESCFMKNLAGITQRKKQKSSRRTDSSDWRRHVKE